ncbi:hypothetical protein [Phocaeicola sartorii]|uniref:hypothetical protein n=1 Tax=Phocaeicola sartorii TaxID=671267 RepID=UPI0014423265|nr:hypothetical protein [Phocaeicola sartorii]
MWCFRYWLVYGMGILAAHPELLISERAPLRGVGLKDSYWYDVPTEAGQTYTLKTML